MAQVNTLKPRSWEGLISKVAQAAKLDKAEIIQLRSALQRVDLTLNDDGSVKQQANVSGRTEPLSTTLQNVESTGEFNSLANVADTSTDHLTDGTGTPLAGGKRGAIALDSNNRLTGSFRANAVNLASVPTSSTTLSNDGVSTAIPITAFTAQFGDGTVSYSSGSVDPGAFGGPYYIYADDPTFAGGAVTYQFSTTIQNQAAANGRVLVGSITTVSGSAKTGGGFSGGTGGSRGGRGFIQ